MKAGRDLTVSSSDLNDYSRETERLAAFFSSTVSLQASRASKSAVCSSRSVSRSKALRRRSNSVRYSSLPKAREIEVAASKRSSAERALAREMHVTKPRVRASSRLQLWLQYQLKGEQSIEQCRSHTLIKLLMLTMRCIISVVSVTQSSKRNALRERRRDCRPPPAIPLTLSPSVQLRVSKRLYIYIYRYIYGMVPDVLTRL